MAKQKTNNFDVADLLMKKYGYLRIEVMFHLQSVKSHARYFQVFMGGSLVAIWYVVSNLPNKEILQEFLNLGISKEYLLVLLMVTITTVSYYFVFDLLDSFYSMMLVGARLWMIEEQINNLGRHPFLIWESLQAAFMGADSPPRVILGFFQFMLVILFSVAMPLYFYIHIGLASDKIIFRAILAAASIYTITCAGLAAYSTNYVVALARFKGRKFMDDLKVRLEAEMKSKLHPTRKFKTIK